MDNRNACTECDHASHDGSVCDIDVSEIGTPCGCEGSPLPTEYGAICNRCKEFYPYAEKVLDFRCYGCRKW